MPHPTSPLRHTTTALFRLCAGVCAVLAMAAPVARAQHSVDLGFAYAQEQSKFVGSSTNNTFYLRGATLDLGYSLWHNLGVGIAANGLSVNNMQPSIDIQEASFMLGPRYTANIGHREDHRLVGVFADAKFGFTFATSGLYPTGTSDLTSHAAGFSYSAGGGVNLHVWRRLDLRVAQIEYVQTHLPNGGTNEQNNLRYSAGLNLHFGS